MSTTSFLAAVSCAFFFWFRNNGMAIAARMPMMIMTTRSSMSVKPCSFSSMALRSRASIAVPPRDDVSPVKEARLLAEPDRGSWADHEGPLALRPHLAVGVPFLAVARMTTRTSDGETGHLNGATEIDTKGLASRFTDQTKADKQSGWATTSAAT